MGEEREDYLKNPAFPQAGDKGIRIESPENSSYNCIAWVLGREDVWYEPDEDYNWPEFLALDYTLDNVQAFFEYFDYEVCQDSSLESNYQKIALFAQNGEFTHVTKQLDSGKWTSKLGVSYDVKHTLEVISQGIYGDVALFMKIRK